MRFLTAYFATLEGKTTLLTGSQRMQERPIKILVDTLRDQLGADIVYDKEDRLSTFANNRKNLAQGRSSHESECE